MGISYGEISALEQEFNRQCESMNIEWVDESVRQEALSQFINDYENGEKEPKVTFCGYGYEQYYG